ncbi:MAG: holo-ACP synthase, partial [Lacunisphaera sp.]
MNLVLPPGGTLVGLGCDLIDVARIEHVLTKHGDRFLKRVFTEEEQAYCGTLKYSYKHYAARWAAKEAVSKCF